MPILQQKPVSPSGRFFLKNKVDLAKKRPERALTKCVHRKKGRNAYGRITSRRRGGGHKRLYRQIDFRREQIDQPSKVIALEYDPNRTAHLALLEFEDGTKTYIFGQYHKLDKVEEEYDDGEWSELEDNRIEIDNFFLTGSEEGFLYELEDIPKFFETKDWGGWDYNGDSDNWCGIEDEDDYETCMKKWRDYKSKFPRVTSKEQFRLIDNYRN